MSTSSLPLCKEGHTYVYDMHLSHTHTEPQSLGLEVQSPYTLPSNRESQFRGEQGKSALGLCWYSEEGKELFFPLGPRSGKALE